MTNRALHNLRATGYVVLVLGFVAVSAAQGQTSAATTPQSSIDSFAVSLDVIRLDTDGFPLEDAIERLVETAAVDISYNPKLLHWKRSGCRIETRSVETALDCVLAGTGLSYRRLESGTFVIVRAETGGSKHTVSGFIQDARSGEMFIGANVFDPARKLGTASNVYGFYSVTLPADSVTLVFSYLGYESAERSLVLTADTRLDVALDPHPITSAEVVVTADRSEPIEARSQMSAVQIPIKQVKAMPTIMGETDLIKAFQLMPGVRSGSEGSSGLFVRGGTPDQTLVLLDGATVYNVSHFFGLFSVFNADAIRHAELIKGGFPARYGGRLSSVLDVGMKEGNMKEFGGEFAIGAAASRLMVEGPISKDRTSFIVSGRRTYIDGLMRPFMPDDEKVGIYFYDLNAKINHKLSDRDHLYLSAYRGNDRFSVDEKQMTYESKGHVQWGNLTSTLRWNHVIGSRLFSNVTAAFTDYNFDIGVVEDDFISDDTYRLDYASGIRDWSIRTDIDWLPNPDHFVRSGLSAVHHTFSPGATVYRVSLDEDVDQPFSLQPADKVGSWEISAYVEDDLRMTSELKVNVGLHGSMYKGDGATYSSLEPRISGRYLLPNGWAVKASYAQMKQYILLLTNSSVGLPTDLWLPVTDRVPPQTSRLIATGVSTSLLDGKFELSVEGYYKTMHGLIEYKSGASFVGIDQDWQNKIEFGDGRSIGIELLLQKQLGRTSGWLAYTLSKTDRTFPNLNKGRTFPFRYDATHDFSLVLTHQLRPGIELSGNWVYTTGNAITLPNRVYYAHPFLESGSCLGCTINSFDERGNYRQRAHHRLDVAVHFHKDTIRGRVQTITVGAYNAYNRMNPFFVTWDGAETLTQFTLFPILPYVTYRRSF